MDQLYSNPVSDGSSKINSSQEYYTLDFTLFFKALVEKIAERTWRDVNEVLTSEQPKND